MKNILIWTQRRIGSLFIIAGIVIAILVFRGLTSLPTAATETALVVEATATTTNDSPLPTPAATGTEAPAPTPSATWAEPPTPTLPPIPTQLPTPIVTPIPLAQPPIIPAPSEPQTYTILYKEGNVLFAVDNHGENQRQIVDVYAETSLYLPLESAIWAAPAPNGQQLALVLSTLPEPSPRRGDPLPQYSIYLFDIVTNQLQLLVQDGVSPVWSPDGTKIAYNHSSSLWVLEVAIGATREVYRIEDKADRYVTDISWAPDSKRLVFLDVLFRQSSTMIIANVDPPSTQAITNIDDQYPYLYPYLAQWSPTNDKILFVGWSKSTLLPDRGFYGLWTINPDGTDQTQLAAEIDDLEMLGSGRPRWSPSGEWIAFPGIAIYEKPEAYWDVWIINPINSQLIRVTDNAIQEIDVSSVEWSPDGSQIIWRIKGTEIWVITLATGNQVKLPMKTKSFVIMP